MLKFPFGTYKFQIKSYDTDQNGKLTLHTLFHFLQECAWDNARKNGFGFEYLEKKNAFWVLSRMMIQMSSYPDWKDEIEIKTWPKGVEGFFALRDFQIFKNAELIGQVSSYWLILDKTSRRPQRLDNFNFNHENFLQEEAIGVKLEKVIFTGTLNECDARKVYPSDLDLNQHVNNATYVRWALDSHFQNGENPVEEFEINFLSELKLNDSFRVYKCTENDFSFFVLKNAQDKEVCRIRLK